MNSSVANGTMRVIDDVARVFYDGYWVKAYQAPADTLQAKRQLIGALTRRLFNHVEHGIDVPGARLEEARRAFDTDEDPQRRRVKGAMLAGALFNRVTDIFTKLVDMQALGVQIRSDNELMRACGEHLQEALTLGKLVLHRSGEEGIDELWGEPFKAFAFPIEDFYKSRYVKIAQTMRTIDTIATALVATFTGVPMFAGIDTLVQGFAAAARLKCETLRTESDIFDIWTSFVVCAEKLASFVPSMAPEATVAQQRAAIDGMTLVRQGRALITDMVRARVPMPKSTHEYCQRLAWYRTDAISCNPPISQPPRPDRHDPPQISRGV